MKKRKALIAAAVIICLAIAGAAYVLLTGQQPQIVLNEDELMVVHVNGEYKDPGVKAFAGKKDVSKTVKTSGTVDTTTPGNYKVTYQTAGTLGLQKAKAVRMVQVVDNLKPTLALNGDSVINLKSGASYTEPGCTASDNCDGDLSGQVKIVGDVDTSKPGIYKLRYEVTDQAGNQASVSRTVKVKSSSGKVDKSVRGLPILMYHFFYDKAAGETCKDNNWMNIADFEEQMKYLHDNNYYYPTWEEVIAFVEGYGTLPEKSVVITVDDGNKSFFRLAVPVLKKYNVKATSFIITCKTGKKTVQKYKSLLSFQSHSHDMHRPGDDGKGRILTISHEGALEDLATSIDITGNQDVFCYPFGHYDDNSKKTLEEAGFSLAVTTHYGRVYPNMDPYELPRVRQSEGEGMNYFKACVK